jgi:hypothetical protein
VIICEIILHLLVRVRNNKRCTVQSIKIKPAEFNFGGDDDDADVLFTRTMKTGYDAPVTYA